MKSIKARFLREKQQHPKLADTTNFIKAVHSQKFVKKTLYQNFRKLVNPEDYNHLTASERKKLFSFVEKVNIEAEEG